MVVRMLEEIESIKISENVFRLANAPQLRAALEQLGRRFTGDQ
jgi:hypothetical protein